jgi:hypothetical protein
VIVRKDAEPLSGAEGARWRFVAQSDDHSEAVRMAELLQLRGPQAAEILRECARPAAETPWAAHG